VVAFLPQRVTEQFYRDVLADTQLRPYFTGVNLGRLKTHLSALLAQAVRSPGPYPIEDLVAAHRGLGLSEDDYDRIGHYLLTRLLRERVGADVLLRVGTVLTEARGPILEGTTRTFDDSREASVSPSFPVGELTATINLRQSG
jgi:hemoglobin